MGDLLQPWHLIVLAVVAFLLFGAKRLPELGKGLGEGLKGFQRRHSRHLRSASTGAEPFSRVRLHRRQPRRSSPRL
jgi:TatA/E family protein of Tat protein translocase